MYHGKSVFLLSTDNASMNMGARNSIKSRALREKPFLFILGCPYHTGHNNASAVGAVYTEVIIELAPVIGYNQVLQSLCMKLRNERVKNIYPSGNHINVTYIVLLLYSLGTFVSITLAFILNEKINLSRTQKSDVEDRAGNVG